MIKVSSLKNSRFLRREDIPPGGLIVTVVGAEVLNVAPESEPERLKPCLRFKGGVKPLVMNLVNGLAGEAIFGTDDMSAWRGRIKLIDDPAVMFGSKVVGGIRIRPVNPKSEPADEPEPEAGDWPDDE